HLGGRAGAGGLPGLDLAGLLADGGRGEERPGGGAGTGDDRGGRLPREGAGGGAAGTDHPGGARGGRGGGGEGGPRGEEAMACFGVFVLLPLVGVGGVVLLTLLPHRARRLILRVAALLLLGLLLAVLFRVLFHPHISPPARLLCFVLLFAVCWLFL